MTKVINLFGGSGIGKSTLAAGLFYAMKSKGMSAELVKEYVKSWAWDNRKVGEFDQLYLTGKQSKAESLLYNKVDYVITDSPILLSAVYDHVYNKTPVVLPAILNFLELAREKGIEHKNFLLSRHKPFNPAGRYETADQAKAIDTKIEYYLTDWGVSFEKLDLPDQERVEYLLDVILKGE